MKTAKERYEDFFKNHLTPFLKARGFKRKSNKFIRYGDELAYVFYVLRGNFNGIDYASFSIDLDFCTRTFEEKGNPRIYKGFILSLDISRFAKSSLKSEIKLKTDDPNPEEHDAEIRDYFLKTIEEKAIPFLETIHSLQDIIHLLETTPEEARFWQWPPHPVIFGTLADLYWILGQKEKALEAIDKGLEERAEKYPGNKIWLRIDTEYRNRILTGGDFYTQLPPPPAKKRKK